jgi:molybdenum cofactor cytidylyltransferase
MIPDVQPTVSVVAAAPTALRIHAIILAAGRGARMGGPKALLALEGETFLARVARLLRRPGVERVTAVIGHEADRIRREAGLAPDVATIVNPRYADGMLTSILAGLEDADAAGADAVLVHPVDHPLVDPLTVDAVIAALRHGAIIAVPSHGGRRGHPAGFARGAWTALREAAPDEGARGVLARHPEWIEYVPAGEECLLGVNTPEDYERLKERQTQRKVDRRG